MSQGNRIPTQGSSYSTDTAMLTVGSKEAAGMDFFAALHLLTTGFEMEIPL